jgi:hypothetical protein
MKIRNIIPALLSGAISLALMVGCQDEVIVKVEDTTTADEIIALINDYRNQYLTLDKENGTLHIQNEKLEHVIDSLQDVRDNMLDPYSTPEEIHYTLNVLSSANTAFSGGRSKGLADATVTLEQNGLVKSADPSSTNGLYLFKGLRTGSAFVTVTAADHTPVEFYVWLDLDFGDDVAEADSYNASSQVILFPNAGSLAGKITGKAYANTSTLNDTIGYRYGTDPAFGTKANTYISSPGNWRYNNYTQDDDYVDARSIYDYPNGDNIQWELALAGHVIYAIPEFDNFDINNESENGWIYSMTYRNVITKATIQPDGSFTLPILGSSSYDEYTLFDYVELTTEDMITSHTRLTQAEGNFPGQKIETGSTDHTFNYYNRTNGVEAVYTGRGLETVNIDPATKAIITRNKITENWAYGMWIPNDAVYDNNSNYLYPDDHAFAQSGETKNINVYFFPLERR